MGEGRGGETPPLKPWPGAGFPLPGITPRSPEKRSVIPTAQAPPKPAAPHTWGWPRNQHFQHPGVERRRPRDAGLGSGSVTGGADRPLAPGSDRTVPPGLRRRTRSLVSTHSATGEPRGPADGELANTRRGVTWPPPRLAVPTSQTKRWPFRSQHAISQLRDGRAGLSGCWAPAHPRPNASGPLVLPDTSLSYLPSEGGGGASF